MEEIAVGFENSAAKRLVFHWLEAANKTFFECSASPIVFLIAAAGMDSRGVLAFGMPICEYGKLLF